MICPFIFLRFSDMNKGECISQMSLSMKEFPFINSSSLDQLHLLEA